MVLKNVGPFSLQPMGPVVNLHVGTKDLSISPRFTPLYRGASLALLQPLNQW